MKEFWVGVFALLGIGSLVAITVQITANRSGMGKHYLYKTIVEDASGLYERASIKVAGINAGSIKAIKLNGNQAEIIFDVTDRIKITKNTVLNIKSVGFLGDKFLDIYLGDPSAPRLAQNAHVKSFTGGGMEDLTKDATVVMSDVKQITKLVRESMLDKDGNNVVSKILANVSEMTESARVVAKSLEDLVGDNSKLKDIIANIDRTTKNLAQESDRNHEGSIMSSFEKLDPMMASANNAMTDLRSIIEDVKAGRGTVGKLLRDEEVIDQVSSTLSGVNRLVNRVNNFKTDIALFSGVNFEHGAHTQIELDLFPAPERFFRLGVVTNEFGPDVEKNTTVTEESGGSTTVTTRREVDDSSFKFNAQIGRKISNLGMRAGLIESTGGLGFDYYLTDKGMKFGIEAFDYQKDVGPNVRLYGEFRLWNIFHTRFTGEDLVSSGNQTFTALAGLRFSDEDLASLIGLMAN